MFFIFFEMTQAVCEAEQDRHNVPTNENHSQFVAPCGSLEQEPNLKEIDSGDTYFIAH